ncbi:hypothetical protein CAPTEDRAFT_203205 [Capitella teleta]|uniref:Uncharacterized protein n=1 Tax=Capitella teleta TaxID=283909 RepID=R7TTC2_CAPTE|nr:hypothetical protein CAPTEDRAFT_203205 [Capitella teleta]|eukprot:ELT96842.1 hypothetical protein CAPTEDRAFT_203205 [Capitella teleta]
MESVQNNTQSMENSTFESFSEPFNASTATTPQDLSNFSSTIHFTTSTSATRGHLIGGSLLTALTDENQGVAFPLDKAVFRTRYILVCVLISVVLAIVFFLCKRKTAQRPWKRRLVPDGLPAKRPRLEILERIYTPIQGDCRDDDYENTFVGTCYTRVIGTEWMRTVFCIEALRFVFASEECLAFKIDGHISAYYFSLTANCHDQCAGIDMVNRLPFTAQPTVPLLADGVSKYLPQPWFPTGLTLSLDAASQSDLCYLEP